MVKKELAHSTLLEVPDMLWVPISQPNTNSQMHGICSVTHSLQHIPSSSCCRSSQEVTSTLVQTRSWFSFCSCAAQERNGTTQSARIEWRAYKRWQTFVTREIVQRWLHAHSDRSWLVLNGARWYFQWSNHNYFWVCLQTILSSCSYSTTGLTIMDLWWIVSRLQRIKTGVHWKQLQNCKTRASPSNLHQKYKTATSPSKPHQKCKTVASPSEPQQKCKTEGHNKAGENLVSSTAQTDHVCDFEEERALGKSEPTPHHMAPNVLTLIRAQWYMSS